MPCTIRRRASIFALSLGKEYFMPAHFIQRAQKYHSESLPRSLSVQRTEVARDRPVYSHPANYSDGVDAYIVHAKERFRGEVARWVDARPTTNRFARIGFKLTQFVYDSLLRSRRTRDDCEAEPLNCLNQTRREICDSVCGDYTIVKKKISPLHL